MTPQEAEIIRSVFARLRGLGEGPRDAEAEGLVEAQMRADPHAALALVRALVMTDRALAEAGAEIERLKQEAEAARGGGAAPAGGGLFDGPWGRPAARPAAAMPAEPAAPAAPAGPWGGRAVDAGGPWGAPAPQGSGFWGSMVRTGVGVAGGLLAVEALKGLFGGGHGGQQAGLFGGGTAGAYDPTLASGLFEAPQTTIVNETVNVFQGGGEAARTAAGTGDSGGFSGGFGGEPAIDPAAFDGEIDDVGFDDDSFA